MPDNAKSDFVTKPMVLMQSLMDITKTLAVTNLVTPLYDYRGRRAVVTGSMPMVYMVRVVTAIGIAHWAWQVNRKNRPYGAIGL
jgi:hypothetical protein